MFSTLTLLFYCILYINKWHVNPGEWRLLRPLFRAQRSASFEKTRAVRARRERIHVWTEDRTGQTSDVCHIGWAPSAWCIQHYRVFLLCHGTSPCPKIVQTETFKIKPVQFFYVVYNCRYKFLQWCWLCRYTYLLVRSYRSKTWMTRVFTRLVGRW